MKMKSRKNFKLPNKNIETANEPHFCGLKSDKSQEEIMEKYIQEDIPSSNSQINSEDFQYCGVKSKAGKLKMRSKFNLKRQAIIHTQTLKQEKKKLKLLKRKKEFQKEKNASKKDMKLIQVKKKEDPEEIKLNKLIDNYTSELITINSRRKWYDSD